MNIQCIEEEEVCFLAKPGARGKRTKYSSRLSESFCYSLYFEYSIIQLLIERQ